MLAIRQVETIAYTRSQPRRFRLANITHRAQCAVAAPKGEQSQEHKA